MAFVGRHISPCVVAMAFLFYGAVPTFAQDPEAAPPEAPAEPSADEAAPETPPPTPDEAAPESPAPAPGEAAPQVDTKLIPPTLKEDVQPVYPAAALAEGLAAEVILDIDIDAAGDVEQAIVKKSAEPQGYGFDQAALEAARKLRFEPARYDGQAVPVRMSFLIRFVPDVNADPAETTEPSEPVEAVAPTGQLLGRLQERGTRLPLAGVKVTVFRGEGDDAEGFESETDAEGGFLFDGLSAGSWRVLANPAGYYPLRATEEITADFRTDVRYSIEKRSYNPYDVVVETRRVKREVSHTSIDARMAERIPGTMGDVLRVVQNFPGVARTNASDVVIRGSDPEDSKVFINSMEVPVLYHFGGLRSVLPVGMIERIDFYPGNFSVEYGRATGGIIDVDLRDLAPQKVGGYADVSLLDTSLYLEVPVTDEFAVAFGGRRSYIGDLLGLFLSGISETLVVPRYYDFQVLASYRPAPAHQIESFFFLSDDIFEILFEEPVAASPKFVITDVGYAVNFHRIISEYRYIPNERFENKLKFSYGRDRIDFNIGPDIFFEVDLHLAQVREIARYELSDSLALRGGLDYAVGNMDWAMRFPNAGEHLELSTEDFTFTEVDITQHATAAYLELEFKPTESLLLIPGVRVDHYSRSDEFHISPRFTGRQDLGHGWTLKAGAGVFSQDPELFETNEDLGNPDLEAERAMHYSVGVEYQPRKHIKLDLTGFYKTLDNLVDETDAVTERDGETVPLRLNNGGEGRVSGLEVSGRHEMANRIFGWLAYTFSKAERKPQGESEYELFQYDQTHIFTIIGSYRLPRNWEISARYRYVTGNLYTPIIGAVYMDGDDEYRPIVGDTNSARVTPFQQVDVRLDKRWVYENWMLNAYLDIQNVLNHANPNSLGYNYDYSKIEHRTGLPIVPIIGLKGEF